MSNLLNGRRLLFFDFEVLVNSISPETGKPYWCVVFIDYATKKGKIIKNNVEELRQFYEACKHDIFISYNGRNYDQWIFKGLLLGYCPAHLTKKLIEEGVKGGMLVRNHNKIPLLHYDAANKFNSLKQLEAFMGSEIKESDVPFWLDRPMTEAEEKDLIKYCVHDVKELIKVLEKTKGTFDSHISLIEMFNIDLINVNKTQAQLNAIILDAKKYKDNGDEYDFIYPETLKLSSKYQYIKEWFDDIKEGRISTEGKVELETEICDNPTVYALGGVHGALKNFQYEGKIFSLDVTSLYPSLILEYGLMSRGVASDEKFREIRDTRIQYKKAGNKLEKVLKLVLNSTYGVLGDQYNDLCDKRMMRSVCVAGQLLLTDFIEKIEAYCKPFNINTDGVFFYIEDDNFDYNFNKIMEAKQEWEQRTRLGLEVEEFTKVVQKDVNNYIVVAKDGSAKAKGAFVKEQNELDYDLPIVNKAVKDYFILNKPTEETITECDDLIEFQKIVKVTSAYNEGAWKDCTFSKQAVLNEKTSKITKKTMWDEGSGHPLQDKTFRIFASNREEDGGLFKKKSNKNPEKFANTSEKVFIDNGEVIGKSVPDYLDKQWYIDLANDRIRQFLGIKKERKTKVKEG